EWQMALFAGDGGRLRNLVLWKSLCQRADSAMHLQKWALAIECYERALALLPDDGVAMLQLGRAFEANGPRGRAVEYYRQAIQTEPFFFPAQLALARLLVRSRHTKEAAEICHSALLTEMIPGFEPFRKPFEELLA